MVIEVKIPSPGESITEVQLARWFVEDGAAVSKDQEIGEIESDKATLPLIAPVAGEVKLLIEAGATVKVGTVACAVDPSKAGNVISSSKVEPVRAEKPVETEKPITIDQPIASSELTASGNTNVKVSPVARKIMEDHNLSVDDVIAGLRRISSNDVEAVIQMNEQKPSVEIRSQAGVASRNQDRKTMSALRKKLAERLVAVKNETAMLTTFNEVDMSAIMALRKKYQPQFEKKFDIKIGFMSFFTKAVCEALQLHPMVNSYIDGDEIVTPSYQDIGIAVSTEKGLMVPVLRNVETMSLADIEKNIAAMAAKARQGRISLDDMSGGTFTITNGGVFGSLLSTPIINPPQSAILGMHNIVDRPIAVDGKVEIRPMMYIALSYDHRIIDGKDSVGFLVKVKQLIENPVKMLFNGANPEELLLGL